MKRRIFNSVLMVTSLTAMITIVSVMLLFFPFMENEILQELQEEANLIVKGMELSGTTYLEGFPDEGRRITLIDGSGTVIFDSGTDIDSMDNHIEREEIQQAVLNGDGSSIRFSDTLTQRTINYAKRMEDGQILRISVSQNYVVALLSRLIPPVCIIIAAVVFLSAVLSGKVSNRILTPLYEMDPEHPENSEIYEEIRPLTQKIQVQNRKLKEKIYGELKRKQRKQSEFTANMTHELKTPLTSISGFAELMMQDDMDSDTVKDFAQSIHEEAGRLISLVGDIIKLAEMDEKEGDYRFEEVHLLEMAHEICESLSISAKKKGITVKVEGDEALVYGEKRILYEMLYNLFDNAIKYNTKDGTVEVKLQKNDDGIYFMIRDTGIGIPPEDQEHIFERFYRVDKSHSNEAGGTGLGLSIVQQGAILHGSDIKISSKEMKGTEITLRFPVTDVKKQTGGVL